MIIIHKTCNNAHKGNFVVIEQNNFRPVMQIII